VTVRIRVLAAIAMSAAVVFTILMTILLVRPEHFAALDTAAADWAVSYRAVWLLAVFLWVTTLGTGAALFGMAATATGFLWASRQTQLILPLWVTFIGAQASVWTLKYRIARSRPEFLLDVATAASPSFPSAHATGSVATLGFIAYAIGRSTPDRTAVRYGTALCAVALVVAIDASRVVLGVHFGSDVIGGFLLGGAWLAAGIAIAEHRRRPRHGQRHEAAQQLKSVDKRHD
jgi:membrane-associated phospholipid phosphatase